MLTINEEQRKAFQNASYRHFIERCRDNLRRNYPEQTSTYDNPELEEYVESSISEASKYGLDTEKSVAYFCHIRLILGDDLGTESGFDWVPKMLNDMEYGQEERSRMALWFLLDIFPPQR